MNDELIQSSFPESNVGDIKAQVQSRVKATVRRRRIIRRSVWSFAATAALAGGFLILPVARGMATILQMGSTLEDVESFRSRSYIVMDDGTLVPSGDMAYDTGKWRIEEPDGELQIYNNGVSYIYDDWMNCFIKELKPDGPFGHNTKGLGLSFLMGPSGLAFMTLESDDRVTEKGKDLRRVTLKNKNVDEWITIYADKEKGLPMRVEQFSLRDGKRRLGGTMEFDYSKPDAKLFTLPYYPLVAPVPLRNMPLRNNDHYKVSLIDAQLRLKNLREKYTDHREEVKVAIQEVAEIKALIAAEKTIDFPDRWQVKPGSEPLSSSGTQPFKLIDESMDPIVTTTDPDAMLIQPTVYDKSEWEQRRADRFAGRVIARKRAGKTEIVIHDLTVEPDGTVWVAYQAGHRLSSYTGDLLDIKSDREYAETSELVASPDRQIWLRKPKVRVEFQCFVPVERGKPAHFYLTAKVKPSGVLDRHLSDNPPPNGKVVTIAQFDPAKFAGPAPKYLKWTASNMVNPIQIEIKKAQAVARYWEAQMHQPKSLESHRKVLSLMEDHARRGYGSFNQESVREAIRRLGG